MTIGKTPCCWSRARRAAAPRQWRSWRDYSKRMEELLRDRLPRLMHGEEDPQEERAEAAALFAEYAIDFAAQGVRSALLAALAAMDQQMNCEEQQGKEHPV